jgi:hypothetical protein
VQPGFFVVCFQGSRGGMTKVKLARKEMGRSGQVAAKQPLKDLAPRMLISSPEDEMAQGFMSPLPTFTLESLVAFRQWTAQQRSGRKKQNPLKSAEKTGRTPAVGSKAVKTP